MFQNFESLVMNSQEFISDQVESTLFINKLYMIISVVLSTLFVGITMYYSNFLNSFKIKVLSFFSELDRDLMNLCEKCSSDFYEFMISNDKEVLKQNKKDVMVYSKSRQNFLNKNKKDMRD